MEKKIKKILSLTFVMLIVIFAFTACGNLVQNGTSGSCKISFNNLKGATIPEITHYDSANGISPDDMPSPEAPGWEFAGWYTASSGGELVEYIPSGGTKDYTLFAHWEAIDYRIIYIDEASNPNPHTYTIEDEIILKDPEWSGLSFSHWQDANGNKVTSIPKGSTGNIELTAYWNYMENLVVPSGDESFTAIYDDELERYHFIVNLGTINNVVLGELGNARGKLYGQALNWEISETVGFEESIANEVAKVITKAVTSSTEWADTTEWVNSNSSEWSYNAGFSELTKIKINASIGYKDTNTSSWSDTTYVGGGESTSEEETDTTSSTVSFKHDKSTTVSISTTTSAEMPDGTYRYVYTGTVRVYAIVTYDPKEDKYFLDLYSHMDETITEMLLYSPNADSKVHIGRNDILGYSIDEGKIDEYINSSYYVMYDANGGEGEMPLSIMGVGENCILYPNAFTKTGYTLLKWELTTDGKVSEFKDAETVKDIAKQGELITLKAIWIPNNYIVEYNANGGDGSMTNSEFTYDAESALRKNDFYKTGYHFVGWNTHKDGSGISFTDEQSIFNLTTETEIIALYAQWEANKYTVNYHANGGSGSMGSSTHTYDSSQDLSANAFSRHGWTFEGWSPSSSGNVMYNNKASVKNLTAAENGVVELYAVWKLKTSWSSGYSDLNVKDTITPYAICYVSNIFDLNELRNQGKTMRVVVSFTIVEHDKGYQDFAIDTGDAYGSGTRLMYQCLEAAGTDKGSQSFSFTADTTILGNSVFVSFGAHGDWNDDYTVTNLSISVSFY